MSADLHVPEPDLSPLPGWEAPPSGDGRPSRSFVSGDPNGSRIRVRYYRGPDGQRVGKVWFGADAEGPPGHAHGGAIAAVLDEAMGTNAWLVGHRVLAGTLQIVYRRPLPLGLVARLRTDIAEVSGRKVVARGWLEDDDGRAYAEGTGTFVIMRPELQAMLDEEASRTGRATPDAYGAG
jgi:acyl-coenzyme A thioesterase PaaI-like protein